MAGYLNTAYNRHTKVGKEQILPHLSHIDAEKLKSKQNFEKTLISFKNQEQKGSKN